MMKRVLSFPVSAAVVLCLGTLLGVVASASSAGDFDWTYWRGPQMNGHSTLKNLPDTWDPEGGEGSNLLWKREDLGTRSTPACLGDKLYLLARDSAGTAQDGEKVVCLNAATGETIWENKFNVYLSDVPAERVAWSNLTVDPETGDVFALGVCGLFQCIDGETGETKWQHSMHEEYGLLSTYGGRTNHPILHENNVLITAVFIGWGDKAKPQDQYIAFDKRNGQPVWYEGTRPLPYDTTYSGAVLTTFDGEAAMVFGSGDGGYHAFQPRTGKKLWNYQVSSRGVNATPLVVDGRLYCGHSEENLDDTKMGAFFAVDGTKRGDLTSSGEIWRVKELFFGKAAPLMIDGLLYVVDDRAKLHVLNPENGEQLSRTPLGRAQRSSPLYADGKIYTCTNSGICYTLKPDGEGGVETLHKVRLPHSSDGSIIAAQGRLYIPLSDSIYCVGREGQSPRGDAPPPLMAAEANLPRDAQPAQLQVVPVESLLTPGQEQQFQVRLYNAKGQWLRNSISSEATYTLDGVGSMNEDGLYYVNSSVRDHGVATVNVTIGDMSGSARIRVVPSLDWRFNFDDGQIPITWVGARYRHIPLDYDLLTKLDQADPQAAQLYIYLTTDFVNFNRTESVYDDSTPAERWKGVLDFLDVDDATKPKTVDEAKETLGLSLKQLVAEKILEGYEFTPWERDLGNGQTSTEIRLTVTRGDRRVEGNGVMTKIKTIPKGARSQSWMGPRTLSNYTVQADVLARKRNQMPDAGLIGQRYTLSLMGESQQLQIRTWTTQLRMAQTVPFAWEAGQWYTLKMQTAVEDGKAVLRGKAWKRGDDEPAEWTVTAEDAPGEHAGSPGLFGDAKVAEILYDNVTVTSNEAEEAED